VILLLAGGCGGGDDATTTTTTAAPPLYPQTATCGVRSADGRESIIAQTPYRDPRPTCRAIIATFAKDGERWRPGYGSTRGEAKTCRLIAPAGNNVGLTIYARDDLCEELEERDWTEEE
jgi:hypothetical protein